MVADEPGLKLVGAEDVADHQIIGPVVSDLVGGFGNVVALLHDELVGFEEAGDLDGNLFAAARRSWDPGDFGYIAAHGDGDAAEELDALGDGVDDFELFVEVLIEEQVELVEGRAGDLPVVLLVHVAEGDGIGKELVELLAHLRADVGVQAVREILYDIAVLLNLLPVLLPVLSYEVFVLGAVTVLGYD
jgi:hypothetical protein